MLTQWKQLITILATITVGATSGWAQSSQPSSDTYQWSAELVSADTTAKTMTVKSWVAYQEAMSELKPFKPGDRVAVVWSGGNNYSNAVRQVRPFESGKRSEDTMVLPAELVSVDTANRYVTVRVKAPESTLQAIKTVKPGEWVTVTSHHHPATDGEAVVAVRPYVTTTETN